MKFTVLGASGFIGSNLISFLKQGNHECYVPKRDDIFTRDQNLGHIIYCIGLTADFRTRHYDTVDAHVTKLLEVLNTASFDSFLYLSSTRVYNGSKDSIEEINLTVNPIHLDDLYNISKLMGESVCLSNSNEKIRVVRLSNVIGHDFLQRIFNFSIKQAVNHNKITLQQPLEISRDYIMVNEVVETIYNIVTKGKDRIYNLASGRNVYKEIIEEIARNTGCELEVTSESKSGLPIISINKIKMSFRLNN